MKTIVPLCLLAFLLSACGLKGPLTLPEDAPKPKIKEKGVESRNKPTAETSEQERRRMLQHNPRIDETITGFA